jgi:hypothetical protein
MKVSAALVSGLGVVSGVWGKPLTVREGAAATSPLQQGSVKGIVDVYGNSVFLGIPFADTTGGQNRYVFSSTTQGDCFLTISLAGRRLKMSRS